jgi:hypothetical protein
MAHFRRSDFQSLCARLYPGEPENIMSEGSNATHNHVYSTSPSAMRRLVSRQRRDASLPRAPPGCPQFRLAEATKLRGNKQLSTQSRE